jgi:hypothetical protein
MLSSYEEGLMGLDSAAQPGHMPIGMNWSD